MGLNLETLVTILVGLTLVILADAMRRMFRDRRSQFKLKGLSKEAPDFAEEEDLDNPELPFGGARVVARRFGSESHEAHDEDTAPENTPAAEAPVTTSVERAPEPATPAAKEVEEPVQEEAFVPTTEPEAEPELAAPAPVGPQPVEPPPVEAPPVEAPQETPAPKPEQPRRPRAPKVKLPEGEAPEVLVARVVPPKGYSFAGPGLLALLKQLGLEFGDMNIFHAYGEGADTNVQQFSMANAVEPGTFDFDTFDEAEHYGFTFFLMLPGPSRPLVALNHMLDVVTSLAKTLGADLEDEQRSVLTPQTMEHLRERVREYERRSRLK